MACCENGLVAIKPKVYSLSSAAAHDRAVLCPTGIFPSMTPNFVQSTNSSDRSNASALCSSELLSRYSASSILYTALTIARNLSSSISVCVSGEVHRSPWPEGPSYGLRHASHPPRARARPFPDIQWPPVASRPAKTEAGRYIRGTFPQSLEHLCLASLQH